MTLAERIKEKRRERRMSQKGLGEKLGVTQGAVAQMELGLRSPSLELIGKLGRVLETSVDWLVSGEGSDTLDIGALEAGDRLLMRRFYEFLRSERAPRRYNA